MVAVELKENGANIPVTRDNRFVFIFLFLILLSCYECMKYPVYTHPHMLLENMEHQHCAAGLAPVGCMLLVLVVRAAYVPDISSLCRQWIRRGTLDILISAYAEMPGLTRKIPNKCIKYP